MADTAPLTPTDAELWQLHMQVPGRHKDPIDFARAVLAKWGQPAHSGEPVAWAQASIADWRRLQSEKVVKLTREAQHKYGFIQPLYTAQPVEREPLSDEEVDSLCKVGPVYAPDGKVTRTPPQYRDELEAAQRYGLRKGERAHGIKKGGQHGAE